MSANYIPHEDDEFNDWQATFVTWLVANGVAHGVVSGRITNLEALQLAWGYAWPDFENARTAFHAATQDKDDKREAFVAEIRDIVATVQKDPATTNEDRVNAGITVPKDGKTPAPVATTHPIAAKIDTSSRTILRIFFADSATPDKKAKPEGQAYCEIREQIGGTAPVNPDAMAFLASETRAPYRADFDAADVGKTVWFAMRWVNTRGKPGPWGPIFSAVVPS